jgi:ketosteroid isomerase-like protein
MISGRPRHGAFPVPGELEEDVSTVRAAYTAIEATDEETVARFMDPDVEWVHPAVTHLPFDGVVRGLPSVVRTAFRKNENGSGPQISADTFLEFDAGVLVAGRFIGDHGMEDSFLHECSVRAGRIERIREYPA